MAAVAIERTISTKTWSKPEAIDAIPNIQPNPGATPPAPPPERAPSVQDCAGCQGTNRKWAVAPVPFVASAPSFDSLVATYAELADEEITAALDDINGEIKEREFIERANTDDLDEREREEFRLLLRRQNALHVVRAQRLIDEIDSDGI